MTIYDLEEQISNFDGVNVSTLSEARVKFKDAPNYLDDLVRLCFDERSNISDGATWILKAELEEGRELSAELTQKIATSLDKLSSWQAQLHLCQLAEYLTLTPHLAERFITWARAFSDHPRPFLRAWAITVRYNLGTQFADYNKETERAICDAKHDKAASVRARIRQLEKGPKLKKI